MYNESIQAYDAAISEMPQQPQYALIGKGMALESLGRYDEAQKAYEQALKDFAEVARKNPRNAQVMYNYGNALRGLQRHNESLQAYEKAIELNPGYIDAGRGKALLLHALGRNAEADEASAKALDLGYRPRITTAVAGSGTVVTEKTEMVPEAAHGQGARV
jgi:tetratricopeptide (TPR) repeat protein